MAFSQFSSIAAVQAAYDIRHVLLGATAAAPAPQFAVDLHWR